MTTWNEMLHDKVEALKEPITHKAPDDETIWDTEFDAGYGSEEGPQVLAWTENYVIFPVCYDGSEWLGSAPRHPRKEGQRHVGG